MNPLSLKMEQQLKAIIDLTSLSTLIATLLGWLPNVAALFTLVWTGIQIYEYFKKKG